MLNWLYKGKPIYSHHDFSKEVIGFTYLITYSNGKLYLGKKIIRNMTRLKPTKKQLALRKNYARKEMRDKPFVDYVGSSKLTKDLVIAKKEILTLHTDKINLTYGELELLVKHDVLRDDKYINENIMARFFKGRIV